jgi:heme/copper-type cytochrome/quinol oxidase subunit 1
MAFLCTFSGMLAAGAIWISLFVELGDAASPVLNAVAAWLSPMTVAGWCFYLALSAACSWLVYRVLRTKMGGDTQPDNGS